MMNNRLYFEAVANWMINNRTLCQLSSETIKHFADWIYTEDRKDYINKELEDRISVYADVIIADKENKITNSDELISLASVYSTLINNDVKLHELDRIQKTASETFKATLFSNTKNNEKTEVNTNECVNVVAEKMQIKKSIIKSIKEIQNTLNLEQLLFNLTNVYHIYSVQKSMC